MRYFFIYGLLLILFPFFLSAQPKTEKVKGVFYLKLAKESTLSNRKHPAISPGQLPNHTIRKMVPLKRSAPGARVSPSVLDGLYKVYVDETVDIDELIDSLAQAANVIYAEPIYREELLYRPDDPELSNGNQPYLEVIKAFDAWDITKGSRDIRIGILDTGIDLHHEDLSSKIYKNENDPVNGVDDDQNGYIDDYLGYDFADGDHVPEADNSGHGSRVAGLAGAHTDNAKGIAGVGYESMLVPLKVFTSADNGGQGSYEAIIYAADNGIDIINISWGSTNSYSRANQDIINYAVLEKNMVIIAAAGNQGNEECYYPACYDHVLSVGATNNGDEKAGFSTYNYQVDLVAPGNAIFSTDNDGYGQDNGTSYSAPLVAGTAALVKSQFPQLSALQVMERIRVTTDDIYPTGTNSSYYGKLGKGRLNVHRAVSETAVKSLRAENLQHHNTIDNYAFFGDTVHLSFDVMNYLDAVSNARIKITCNSQHVQVLQEELAIGTLGYLQSVTVNEPLIVLDEHTPPETEIVIRLDFIDGSYEDFQYYTFKTAPDYVNFGNEQLRVTIAGNGNLGYTGNNQNKGIGMEWQGRQVLSTMSFLVAATPDQVSDNLPTHTNSSLKEKDFAVQQPVKISRSEHNRPIAYSTFSDDSATAPLGIRVDQQVYAAPDENYLIWEYRLINTTQDTLKHLASGLYLDWHLNVGHQNRTAYDKQTRTLITYSHDGTAFAGIRTFYDEFPVAQAMNIQATDEQAADVSGAIHDTTKYALATIPAYDSAGMSGAGSNVANMMTQDSIDIAPLESKKVTFFVALAEQTEKMHRQLELADSTYREILSRPPSHQSFVSCEGASLELRPEGGQSFRFYSDPYAQELITTGASFVTGPIRHDTTFYLQRMDAGYPTDVQRLEIKLVKDVAQFRMSADTLFLDDPQLNPVTFYDESFLPTSWRWDFGNGKQANIPNPTVSYQHPGTYSVSLEVENELGCRSSKQKNLLVAHRPEKPVIPTKTICPNEPFLLKAENTDSIAVYRQVEDLHPVMKTKKVLLHAIARDTCLYVTNISGPFESLRQQVCIDVEQVNSSFSYAPDTLSVENQVILTNTSLETHTSEWWVDGTSMGSEGQIAFPVLRENYVVSLYSVSTNGCEDSVSRTLTFQPSPLPEVASVTTCYGEPVAIRPTNGRYFGFYADAAFTSLIKKGSELNIDSVTTDLQLYIAGLDSILPSPPVEVTIQPERQSVAIKASPDTLILTQSPKASFHADGPITSWKWYRNGQLEETLPEPVLFFDSAGAYELVMQAQTTSGCTATDTLHYVVLSEKITPPPLNAIMPADHAASVLPNPSSGVFFVRNLKPDAHVMVTDLSGRKIAGFKAKKTSLQVDISDQKPGIYILRIMHSQHIWYEKVRIR